MTVDHVVAVTGARRDHAATVAGYLDAVAGMERFRDRVCFASHATLAAMMGVSVRTVIRAQQTALRHGLVERVEFRKARTVAVRVARGYTRLALHRRQKANCHTTPSAGNRKSYQSLRDWPFGLKELFLGDDLQRREPTARDIVAATIDTLRLHGVPLMPRGKGIIARKSKELLQAGFEPEVVLTAAVIGVRRGEPQQMDYIAQDIALVQAGQRMTRADFAAELKHAEAKLRLAPGEYEAIYGRKGDAE